MGSLTAPAAELASAPDEREVQGSHHVCTPSSASRWGSALPLRGRPLAGETHAFCRQQYFFARLGQRRGSSIATSSSPETGMHLTVEVDREEDGRWIAEVPDLKGVLAYGSSREEAIAHAQALALRVLADRLEHGEAGPDLVSVSFRAA
jgi:predicted RNase H-like HicB family nuclease